LQILFNQSQQSNCGVKIARLTSSGTQFPSLQTLLANQYGSLSDLVQNPIVVLLWDAKKLTIINFCMHDAVVNLFLIRRSNTKTANTQAVTTITVATCQLTQSNFHQYIRVFTKVYYFRIHQLYADYFFASSTMPQELQQLIESSLNYEQIGGKSLGTFRQTANDF
jgi:hypothetical protein